MSKNAGVHCRDHLLNWLTKAAKDDVLLLNALNNSGTGVKLLGTFDPLPGSKKSGWLVHLTTQHGREELVAIVKDHLGRPHHIFFTEFCCIDWSKWQGPSDDVLIGGDSNESGTKESSNTGKFHRIERSTGIHIQKDRSTGDSPAGVQVDKKRSNRPNVPSPTPPVFS
jgi:hypothetical protein